MKKQQTKECGSFRKLSPEFCPNGDVAGEPRVAVRRKLPLREVPVIVLDHLTDPPKRAYIIADNQLALNAG